MPWIDRTKPEPEFPGESPARTPGSLPAPARAGRPVPILGPDDPAGEAEALGSLEESLENLQEVLREALAGVGVRNPGPASIGRRLGLDKSIAWKVGRIAKAKHPLEAIEFVPGSQGARIVVEAFAATAELDQPLVERLRGAFEALEVEVEAHAGDRRTATALARGVLRDPASPLIDENLRREQFRTASAIWGAQARVLVKTDILTPNLAGSGLDTVSVEGLVDLLRLRPDVRWRVARKSVERNTAVQARRFEPLDPAIPADAPPLFARYCSRPLPDLEVLQDTDGRANYELPPGLLGKTGAITCMVATFCRDTISFEGGAAELEPLDVHGGIHLRSPAELFVLELMVHRSLVTDRAPTADLFGQLMGGPDTLASLRRQTLPIPLRIEGSAARAGVQPLPEVPGHARALRDAFSLAAARGNPEAWRPEDFVTYRVRLTYPPVPSFGMLSLHLRHPG